MEMDAPEMILLAVMVPAASVIVGVMAWRGAFGRDAFLNAPRRTGRMQGWGVLIAIGLWLIGPGLALAVAMEIGGVGGELEGVAGGQAMWVKILCTQIGALPMMGFILWYASSECENGLVGFGVMGDRLKRGLVWGLVGGVLVFVVTQGLSVVVMLGGKALGLESPQIAHEALQELADDPGGKLSLLITLSAVVGAPLLEELLFRGLLQTWLTQSPVLGFLHRGGEMGREGGDGDVGEDTWTGERNRAIGLDRWLAIVICSLLFALIHLPIASPLALPSYYVLGLGFGYAYERTGSLWAPILMHAVFNGINIFLVTSGQVG